MCYQSCLEYRNSQSVTMKRSRNGTLMSLNSQDFENLESVEELYFGERETEDNQERAFTFSILKNPVEGHK